MIKINNGESGSRHFNSLAFFRSLTMFSGLSDAELARFIDVAQIKDYNKGKIVYVEGEQAKYFYIICSGWLKLFHTTEEGEEVVLAMLTGNSIIGESSIFERGKFASTAEVAKDAQILSIPLTLLKTQMRTNSQLAINMVTSLVQYQRRHELQLQQYAFYSAPQRVGCFLLGLCPKLEQKDGVTFNIPYDKSLIASTLGMKAQTFSRALNVLREESGLIITGEHVKIVSINRLLDFINGCNLLNKLHEN